MLMCWMSVVGMESSPVPPENNRYPLRPNQEGWLFSLFCEGGTPVRFGFIAGADGLTVSDPLIYVLYKR